MVWTVTVPNRKSKSAVGFASGPDRIARDRATYLAIMSSHFRDGEGGVSISKENWKFRSVSGHLIRSYRHFHAKLRVWVGVRAEYHLAAKT